MSIKAFYPVLLCCIFLISCRETEPREEKDLLNTEENEFSPVDRNIPREAVDDSDYEVKEDDNSNTSGNTENSRVQESTPGKSGSQNNQTALTGRFIKKGEESDTACNCYCLDLSSNTAELCLVNGKMYVNTRLQKNSNNTIDVFFVEPSARNTDDRKIPWEDFDRNNAIATIKPKSNGELELDWLGFKINGDLAIDYAIFGKKTLEGDYKKK